MRRLGLLTVAWLAATGLATVMAWAGVGVVTRAVAGSPAPVLPRARVAADLARDGSPSTAAGSSGASLAAIGSGGTEGAASSGHGASGASGSAATGGVLSAGSAGGGRGTGPGAGATGAGSTGTGGTGTGGTGTGTGTRGTGTGGSPGPVTATFDPAGGTVTVTCTGNAVTLDSAVPADGFTVTVQDAGPSQVAVTFASDQARDPFAAACSDGQPRPVQPGSPAGAGSPGTAGTPGGMAGAGSTGAPGGEGPGGGTTGTGGWPPSGGGPGQQGGSGDQGWTGAGAGRDRP